MACAQIKAGHPVEIPEEVELWRMCKMFHCLPYPGCLLEQPDHLLRSFQVIDSILGGEGQEELQQMFKAMLGK